MLQDLRRLQRWRRIYALDAAGVLFSMFIMRRIEFRTPLRRCFFSFGRCILFLRLHRPQHLKPIRWSKQITTSKIKMTRETVSTALVAWPLHFHNMVLIYLKKGAG